MAGQEHTDSEPDDEIHIIRNVTRRRGRRPLPPGEKLEPFSLRLRACDVGKLYTQWSQTPDAPRFQTWLRSRLLEGLKN